MINLLENCSTAYPYTLSELPADLVIKAGLVSGTYYMVKVTDKFGNKFSTSPIQAAGDGSLTFTMPNSFPTCWFNRNAGKFYVEVSEHAQPWAPVNLTFGGIVYTQIIVEFVNDNTGINTIQ